MKIPPKLSTSFRTIFPTRRLAPVTSEVPRTSQRLLIKLGGAALQDPQVTVQICRDIQNLHQEGFEVILVHGGGPRINQELTRRKIQWSFIEGQRVTTSEMMEVIEMVLCGQVNREIVKTLQKVGANSFGASGLDARLFECIQMNPLLGQVGQIERVNAKWLESLLDYIPVVAPVGLGQNGESYNINADWAASHLAQALRVDRLVFVTDQNGILDGSGNLIEEVSLEGLEELMSIRVIQGGMMAKARAIQIALKNGIPRVGILNGKQPGALADLILRKVRLGTECQLASVSEGLKVRSLSSLEERKLKNA